MSTVPTNSRTTIVVKRSLLHNRSLSDVALLDLGDTMSSAMGQSLFNFATAKDWNDPLKQV